MQRFVAELSGLINKGEFEKSWKSDSRIDLDRTVGFVFDGRRISITVDSKVSQNWPADDLHRMFSQAIRRVDQCCNIRWL
jgi:hypothetical protein